MKTHSFQTLRRKPVLAAGLAIAMFAGTYYYVSTAESREHRKAASEVAAAHVNLLSSLTVAPPAPVENANENAAVAVLRAATASTSALAFVPDAD